MLRKLALLAAISPALWLSSAAALGLGEIDVKSALNQRFVAVIPLTAVSAEEAEGAQVSLASYAEFQRAGLERSDYLSSLRFAVRTDGGAPRIEVSSAQIAREPFVNFLVEVRSQGNRLLREYTVLLDPPGFQPAPSAPVVAAAPARPAAVAPVAPAAKPAAAAPKPATPEFFETSEESASRPSAPAVAPQAPIASASSSEPTAAVAQGDSYGPVKAGETFWSIASGLRDPSATMPQMLLAIYEANRGAFDGGINGLRIGSTLQIPSLEQITSVPPATAKARVDALRAGPSAAKPKPAAVVPAPTPAPAVVEPRPAVKAPEPAAAPPPKPATVAAPPEPAPALPPAEPVAPTEPVAVPPPAESAGAADQPGAVSGETPAPPADATTEAPAAPEAAPEQPVAEIPVEETLATTEPESEGGLVEMLIPLIGLLLVIGGGGYLASNLLKKRKEAKAPKLGAMSPPPTTRSSSAKPAAAAAAVAAKPTAAELQRLDDTLNDATESFDTQQLQTQQIPALAQQPEIRRVESSGEATSQLPTFDSTQNFNAPKKATESGDLDFDLTGQFAAETVQINLDANDPVAEADFHLAYGLYDEAILLLKQAAQKDPGRSELGVKLAETYFAAGRPTEFQETAESLLGRVDEGSWQKIAIMGQQLCPDAEVFKGAELGGMSTDVDLMFDEPSSAAATELPELPQAAAQPQDNGLDFRLEELELPKLDTTVKADLPELKDDHALEFDLGDFDLSDTRGQDKPAQPQGNEVAFELGAADSAGFEDLAGTLPGKPLQASETSVQLDDFDLGDLGSDSDSISAGDETSTKLDLARAYVDMGDNEMARSLLSEVLTQGSDAQKHEAQNLLGRLS